MFDLHLIIIFHKSKLSLGLAFPFPLPQVVFSTAHLFRVAPFLKRSVFISALVSGHWRGSRLGEHLSVTLCVLES